MGNAGFLFAVPLLQLEQGGMKVERTSSYYLPLITYLPMADSVWPERHGHISTLGAWGLPCGWEGWLMGWPDNLNGIPHPPKILSQIFMVDQPRDLVSNFTSDFQLNSGAAVGDGEQAFSLLIAP